MAKLKKKGIITIIVLSVIVLALALTVGIILSNVYRNTKKLSNEEKIFFNEQVILSSDIVDNNYVLSQDSSNYDHVVYDINNHIKAYEQIIFSPNFRHTKKEVEGEYNYQVKLSYYAINNMQYIYEVKYNYSDHIMEGIISTDDIESISFKSTYSESEGFITTVNYNGKKRNCSYNEEDNKYRISTASGNTKDDFVIDVKNQKLITSVDNEYTSVVLSGKLQFKVKTYDLDTSVTVGVKMDENKYYYEYKFGDSAQDIITVLR